MSYQYPPIENYDDTLALAHDIIEMSKHLDNMKEQLAKSLLRNEMVDFITIDWKRLRKVINRDISFTKGD